MLCNAGCRDGLSGESRRWHSFKIEGRDDAGKRTGREKAWIEVKLLSS